MGVRQWVKIGAFMPFYGGWIFCMVEMVKTEKEKKLRIPRLKKASYSFFFTLTYGRDIFIFLFTTIHFLF